MASAPNPKLFHHKHYPWPTEVFEILDCPPLYPLSVEHSILIPETPNLAGTVTYIRNALCEDIIGIGAFP